MGSGFLLLQASHNGSGLNFFVHRPEADSLPSLVVTDSFPWHCLSLVLEVM